MDPTLRNAYSAGYSPALYASYRERLRQRVGVPGFRLAETPAFLPTALRDRLEAHATDILTQLSSPEFVARMRAAIPPRFDAPDIDVLPNCAQIDFAIVRGHDGALDGRVVELQGFPSLYAFTLEQATAWNDTVRDLPGFGQELSPRFGGLDVQRARQWLRQAVVADEDPEHVVILDLSPAMQKTAVDFVATKTLLGVDAVCPTELRREGARLFRDKDGRRVPIRRIFNRIVFDELEAKGTPLPFAYTEHLDVTWCPHPNWYWLWSKYSLPWLRHPAIPQARVLADVHEVPRDLEDYVLKPLFSFAGGGVRVDVTAQDIERVPAEARGQWLLQRKIAYARELFTPDRDGVAVEVRVMCLRAPGETAMRPAWNLVRLSRGKMHGVDHNKDTPWTGSTVGLWPADA